MLKNFSERKDLLKPKVMDLYNQLIKKEITQEEYQDMLIKSGIKYVDGG